jgi:hypothetical protein
LTAKSLLLVGCGGLVSGGRVSRQATVILGVRLAGVEALAAELGQNELTAGHNLADLAGRKKVVSPRWIVLAGLTFY